MPLTASTTWHERNDILFEYPLDSNVRFYKALYNVFCIVYLTILLKSNKILLCQL